MKLSNKTAKHIAKLINSLEVGKMMYTDALANKDAKSFDLWSTHYNNACNKLAEYGIMVGKV